MFSWVLDHVPYWVWFVVGAVALAATYPMWSAIWLLTPRWLKTVLIAIASLVAAYLAGRNRGTKDAKDAQAKANAEAVKRRLDTNDEVTRMRPADRDKSLDRWLRD